MSKQTPKNPFLWPWTNKLTMSKQIFFQIIFWTKLADELNTLRERVLYPDKESFVSKLYGAWGQTFLYDTYNNIYTNEAYVMFTAN